MHGKKEEVEDSFLNGHDELTLTVVPWFQNVDYRFFFLTMLLFVFEKG